MGRFSDAQLATLHTVILVSCGLSIVGSLYIIVHHFRLRSHGATTSTQTMIAVLGLLDLAISVPKMVGIAGPDGSFECDVQGFLLGFLGVMSVIWNACLAHSIYKKIVCRESEDKLQRRMRLYVVLTIVPAFAGSCVQLAFGVFGQAIFYCWVHDLKLHIVCLYSWVVLAILYITVVLFTTQHHINKRAEIQGNLEAFESSAAITRQLRLYIVVFVISWLPSVIFRVFGSLLGLATFPMAIVMQVTLCSLGFVTAIIYGGLLTQPLRLCKFRRASNDYHAMTAPTNMTTAMTGGSALDSSMNGRRQPLGIFVTTFNMGEGSITDEELEKWIPRGHDMYVIGVQECLHLTELRQQIRHHIEGQANLRTNTRSRSRFVRYAQFCREIGSTNTKLGYHGYIAITVFVRQRDVMSGAFFMAPKAQQAMNCGKSLLFGQRASNKGAVGFGFRYFDTSFAFVTCHLTSDLKGKSHVDRRNRDAVDVIKTLHLNVDDLGFEFPLMHHHTFVLGDLNYRLRQREATPQKILELMVNARLASAALAAGSGNAMLLSSGSSVVSIRSRGGRRETTKKHKNPTPWLLNTVSSGGDSDYATTVTSCEGRTSTEETSGRGFGFGGGGDGGVLEESSTGVVSGKKQTTIHKQIEIPVMGGGRHDSSHDHDDSGHETPTLEERGNVSSNEDTASCRQPGDPWEDVLVHDELRHLMNESQVFYGFEEPKITFDPTFRRVRQRGLPPGKQQLSAEELSSYYTTSIDGRGQRVPSYTDRILHFSQPDMRLRLQCSQYQSAEQVTCSDHKPVVAIFHTAVNREFRPLVARADLEARRLQAVPGVVECAIQIECSSLTWNENAHPVLDSINLNLLRVTVMFPLPSEDAFSEQRTLHEFAAHLRGGVFTSASASGAEPMSNSATLAYQEFRHQGLHHVTIARLVRSMHLAVKIHTDSAAPSSRCVGQGVIGLPKSVLEGTGERMPFLMSLSRGGQLRGTLEGYVSLTTAQASGV